MFETLLNVPERVTDAARETVAVIVVEEMSEDPQRCHLAANSLR